MRYKKIMILAIFLVSLFAIGVVSAADNVTDDVVGLEETIDDVISVENDSQVVANENDVGSFDDLITEMEKIDEGGVLTLTKDYKYVSGSDRGITISKSITIDGKGHTLDGNHLSRIIYIGVGNVYLKNINFVNGYCSDFEMSFGGAIYNAGYTGSVVNCSFINNTAAGGGAVHINNWDPTYFPVVNCLFINNSDGALRGDYAENCTFINNYAFFDFRAGAMRGDLAVNCTFINNSAFDYAGAFHGVSAVNCTFINNSAASDGGAFYGSLGSAGTVVNCTFINNYANHFGGSVYVCEDNSVITNCTFIDSSAPLGGAIYSSKNNVLINNCSFSNSFAEFGDSIYMVSGVLNNSYFENDDDNCYIFKNVKFIRKIPELTLNDATFNYNNISDYIISLKYNDGALNNKKIYLELSKGDYIINYEFTTSERGIINLLPLLKNLDGGTWNIKASFLGTVNYEAVCKTSKITINPTESPSGDVLVIIQNLNNTVQSQANLISNLNSTINNLNATVQSQANLISDFNSTINDLNATVQSQVGLISGLNVTVNNQNGVIDELNIAVQSQNNLIREFNQTIINQNNLISGLNETVNIQSKVIGELNATVQSQSGLIDSLDVTVNNQNAMIADLNNTINNFNHTLSMKNTTISASSITTVYNDGKYLIVTLTDSEYRTLVGAPITVTLNGKTTNYTTDIYGQIKISTNDLVPNAYSTTITFVGDDLYASLSKTVNIVINKATPTVIAPAKTFKVSVKTKSYSVTLKNNNEVMKNTYVSLSVNGRTYYEKTNSKGQATFKITNLNKKATFKAVVKYAGDNCYNTIKVNTKIVCK